MILPFALMICIRAHGYQSPIHPAILEFVEQNGNRLLRRMHQLGKESILSRTEWILSCREARLASVLGIPLLESERVNCLESSGSTYPRRKVAVLVLSFHQLWL